MVKMMENPMSKWMIWKENPLFLETPKWNIALMESKELIFYSDPSSTSMVVGTSWDPAFRGKSTDTQARYEGFWKTRAYKWPAINGQTWS